MAEGASRRVSACGLTQYVLPAADLHAAFSESQAALPSHLQAICSSLAEALLAEWHEYPTLWPQKQLFFFKLFTFPREMGEIKPIWVRLSPWYRKEECEQWMNHLSLQNDKKQPAFQSFIASWKGRRLSCVWYRLLSNRCNVAMIFKRSL